MAEIRVDLQYLTNVASHIREVEHSLRNFSTLAASALYSSPVVRVAYSDFSKRWDERREALANGLSTIAEGFDMTRQNFEQADSDMAAQLQNDSD